jgi:hypothetical protein
VNLCGLAQKGRFLSPVPVAGRFANSHGIKGGIAVTFAPATAQYLIRNSAACVSTLVQHLPVAGQSNVFIETLKQSDHGVSTVIVPDETHEQTRPHVGI